MSGLRYRKFPDGKTYEAMYIGGPFSELGGWKTGVYYTVLGWRMTGGQPILVTKEHSTWGWVRETGQELYAADEVMVKAAQDMQENYRAEWAALRERYQEQWDTMILPNVERLDAKTLVIGEAP